MLDAIRVWMEMGVDGFRLDAIPYLIERDGTSSENLPGTHEIIARVRSMVDAEFPGKIILAEANQMPHEVVEYFGTPEAPECHMCFHFPVMPRIYYALKDERANAIIDVLAETPDLPVSGGQWGTFLRNHDELTLEMVTDDERAKMYAWYAPDPRMKANVGIRRRLAPVLDNSRAQLELINALVLSLPGSPCLYYGDEIGMGDNIWLNDRDASRTPMQWTPDRNAGFSDADPGKLYLPVISSLVHNPAAVNVESQMAQPESLLHFMRGILAARRAHPAFGEGDYVGRTASNEAVLSFTRTDANETILVGANLSATPQSATIDLPGFEGATVTDILGGATFPAVGADGKVTLTFPARGYYWLTLTK
jgi:maltose alpha-D-glucosyltransferase/alpha-amylase